MKVITAHSARDLRIEQRPEPETGPGQLLIRVAAGGICGSDLHYYNHGGFGSVRLREPMILGHEVSGHIASIGSRVTGFNEGQLVAISPSQPCDMCRYCREGMQNHCLDMQFYGSAMPFPHIQGAFREWLVVTPDQCADATGLTAGEAAMAEPLAVVLHAAGNAGDLLGQRVLVTGCGPIGALAVMVARAAGAAEVVATDIAPFALSKAQLAGADSVFNVAENPEALAQFATEKGHFDVLFECSGAVSAVTAAVSALRPRGVIMQLGLGGDMALPMQAITAKELQLRGSFRFHEEFFTAAELMRSKRVDVSSLITQTIPLNDAKTAFDLAGDRSQTIKAQIAFS